MFFSNYITHPKWIEWNKKSYKEQEEIAEKNRWYWYFEWFDVGDNLRYEYEKADKDPKVANKYDGYDRWYDKHKTVTSDISSRQWTEYNMCTNKKCPYQNNKDCGFFGENARMYDCFNEIFASIQAFIDVCGISEIDKLQKKFNIHKDIIGWFKYGDKYFNEVKTMSKPFLTGLAELDESQDITVYWDEDCMYVADGYGREISTTSSLYDAYRFAVLVRANNFDYTASDDEVKRLSEKMLNLIDEEYRAINIWEYYDDIADDFKKLTGIQLDIQDKRTVVVNMTEMGDGIDIFRGFGSATFIAKALWDYIKGNEKFKIKKCDNKIINALADKYLQSDEYDLYKFAQALHNNIEKEKIINIRGAVWINNAKYEYVDYLAVTTEEVELYQNGFMIGSIERDKINTIEEQYVELNEINNLEDIIDFNIKKVGDF